jgi:NAD(P)-dependent dehydrogenase (short-subunit alcohol dehydrogenase family)
MSVSLNANTSQTDVIPLALNTNVTAAFSFSREAILKFKENTIDAENPNRGTLIFTGATASMRGNTMTSAFSIGKFGARALSQSLAKEFGKDDIHVCNLFFFVTCYSAGSR